MMVLVKHHLKIPVITVMTYLFCATSVAQIEQTTVEQDSDANEPVVEEIIVTGSYMKSSPLDAPSPVQVVDRNSIEAQGAAVIWDVIKNLEVNSGSFTNSGSGERSQVEGTAQVNLRNLGENSTLTLINGKRMASAAGTTTTGGEFVNLNSIPLVMTDRVEILTDGGSALYGADAVAGVVNVIMRTDFEGFELYGDVQGVSAADNAYDTTLSGIWGWTSDSGNTHFVLSAERFERDAVNILAGNHIDENSQFLATTSSVGGVVDIASFGANLNPAYLNQAVIDQNVAEGGSAEPIYSDPLCLTFSSVDGTPFQFGSNRAQRGENGGACREDVSEFNFLARDTERTSFAFAFDHTFSEAVEFYSFANFSENEIILEGGGLNNTGGSSTTRGPTVFFATPGAYTRNPFFGGNAIGQTLELGFFAPDIGLTRPTLADIPNAPVDINNGGANVAFWANPRDGIPRDGKRSNTTETYSTLVQFGLRGDFSFNNRAWNYDAGFSLGATSNEQSYQTFNRQRTELAANGLGGPNCTPNGVTDFDYAGQLGPFGGAVPQAWDFFGGVFDQTFFPGFVFTTRESISLALTSNNQGQGGCEFYNPFLSALTNPNVANSPELMDWLNQTVLRADKRNTLAVFDGVVAGELFEMSGGTAQFAAGAQYRERVASSKAPTLNDPGIPNAILGYDASGVPNQFHYVANNFECSNCIFNFNNERTTTAVFLELSLPFIKNVETQVALRYEDYGGNIGSELSHKLALSWRPIESLLLRGSWSSSFRAPNIGIVEEGLEAGSTVFRDPISSQRVRAGLDEPTVANGEVEQTFTLGAPAPNVGNETADTFNVGVVWTPQNSLDGFSVGADFWRFEVQDRVLPQPPIDALRPEITNFLVARADNGNYILNDTIPADSPVLNVPCDPVALEATFGQDSPERLNCVVNPLSYLTSGIQRAALSSTANLITLTLAAINAGEIEADGLDFKMGYRWASDWGSFGAGIDYTYVRQYKIINVPGLEFGLLDTGVLDAAGTTGDGLLVRSMPDNKGHLTLSWQKDFQGVTIINRYIGSYQDLSYDAVFANGNDLVRSLARRTISSYSTWDIQYRYTHEFANTSLGTATFTLGLLDALDEDLPYRETGGLNYDASVFDPRGRRWYLRALMQF